MRIAVFLLSVLCLCISGCAPTQLSRSDIPAWDEGISLDSAGTEPSSLSDRLLDTFVGNSNYHFRKVRWGFSRERVEFSEAWNTVFERRSNAVVYKCKVNDKESRTDEYRRMHTNPEEQLAVAPHPSTFFCVIIFPKLCQKKMCASGHIPVLLSRIGAYRSFCGMLYDTRRDFFYHTKNRLLNTYCHSQKEVKTVGRKVYSSIDSETYYFYPHVSTRHSAVKIHKPRRTPTARQDFSVQEMSRRRFVSMDGMRHKLKAERTKSQRGFIMNSFEIPQT